MSDNAVEIYVIVALGAFLIGMSKGEMGATLGALTVTIGPLFLVDAPSDLIRTIGRSSVRRPTSS